MTDHSDGTAPETADLDGHSIEELSDYLDAGRQPRNESIESSAGCQIALDSLAKTSSWMAEHIGRSSPSRVVTALAAAHNPTTEERIHG